MKKFLVVIIWVCFIQGAEYKQLKDQESAELDSLQQGRLPLAIRTPGSVISVEWSPGGNALACGLDDGTIRTLDPLLSKAKVVDISFNKGPFSWSPDGSRLVYGRLTKPLVMYEISTKKTEVFENQLDFFPASLDWTGNYIAFCGRVVGFVNATTHEVNKWNAHDGNSTVVKFSPNSAFLASGAVDKLVKTWDVQTRQCILMLAGHSRCISALGWHPNSNQLASGSKDGSLRLWDVRSGNNTQVFHQHDSDVNSLQYHPDGNKLVASFDDKVFVWDLRTSAFLPLAKRQRAITALSIHPTDSKLVYGTINGYLSVIGIPEGVPVELEEDAIEIVSRTDDPLEGTRDKRCCVIL